MAVIVLLVVGSVFLFIFSKVVVGSSVFFVSWSGEFVDEIALCVGAVVEC